MTYRPLTTHWPLTLTIEPVDGQDSTALTDVAKLAAVAIIREVSVTPAVGGLDKAARLIRLLLASVITENEQGEFPQEKRDIRDLAKEVGLPNSAVVSTDVASRIVPHGHVVGRYLEGQIKRIVDY